MRNETAGETILCDKKRANVLLKTSMGVFLIMLRRTFVIHVCVCVCVCVSV